MLGDITALDEVVTLISVVFCKSCVAKDPVEVDAGGVGRLFMILALNLDLLVYSLALS